MWVLSHSGKAFGSALSQLTPRVCQQANPLNTELVTWVLMCGSGQKGDATHWLVLCSKFCVILTSHLGHERHEHPALLCLTTCAKLVCHLQCVFCHCTAARTVHSTGRNSLDLPYLCSVLSLALMSSQVCDTAEGNPLRQNGTWSAAMLGSFT